VRVEVCFLEGVHEEFGDGRVEDISPSGVRFISDSHPPKGSPMVLKFHFPKPFQARGDVKLRARVVRNSRIGGHKNLYSIACAFNQPAAIL